MAILILGVPAGCETYRIERHKRSPIFFNDEYVEGGAVRQVELDDGTVVMFDPIETQSSYGRGDKAKSEPFKIREETEDGEIVLRALMPEHVLLNLLGCLRNAEYELIYDQLLCENTRQAYESGEGYDAFVTYMRRYRQDIASLLTRMISGFAHQQVLVTEIGDGVTRCRLRPRLAEQFKFKHVDVVREWPSGQYKLLMVG